MVYCKPDKTGDVAKWVCQGLGDNIEEYGSNLTLGVYKGDNLIAGIILNDLRPNIDVWMTIYSTSKYWATKRTLKYIFWVVFDVMRCRRASLFVSKANEASIKFVEKCGFIREGLLRQYRDNGQDCFVYGMLKTECKWRNYE
jgi:RimJ/RimL family protein N-acetyltransferase